MYHYGRKSKDALSTCCNELQDVFTEALATGIMDISIIFGHRDKTLQNELFAQGKSQLQYPKSYHNKEPALAVDAVPYPSAWTNEKLMYQLNGIVQTIAKRKGYKITWGGEWKSFPDLAHWQYEGRINE